MDAIFPDTVLFGHAGDAYGLISDNFIEPISGYGLIFMTNGPKTPSFQFKLSNSSSFYEPEFRTFEALNKYSRAKCLSQMTAAATSQ